MKSFIFGHSRWDQPIFAHQFGDQGPELLLIGGVHGDEPEGFTLASALLETFLFNYNFKIKTTIIPIFNPDGAFQRERCNGAGVDLNRNLPTKDWSAVAAKPRYNPGPTANSEPENQALTKWLTKQKPKLIVSFHSWEPMLNTNGDCEGVAQHLAAIINYKVTPDIGYPTPGSLGTYAGFENQIPTLTYEIQRDLRLDEVIKIHRPAFLSAMSYLEKNL